MEERRSLNICLIASLLVHLLFAVAVPSLGLLGATHAKTSPPKLDLVAIEFPETSGVQPVVASLREVEPPGQTDIEPPITQARRVAQPAELAPGRQAVQAPQLARESQVTETRQAAQAPQLARESLVTETPQIAQASPVAATPQVAQAPPASEAPQVSQAAKAVVDVPVRIAALKPPSGAASVMSSTSRLVAATAEGSSIALPSTAPSPALSRTPSPVPPAAPSSNVTAAPPGPVQASPAGSSPTQAARPVVHRESPNYPAEARREGWEGRVRLEVLVSPSGKVTTARVVESSGHASLDKAARYAAMKWRFTPAQAQPLGTAPESEPRFINIVFELK